MEYIEFVDIVKADDVSKLITRIDQTGRSIKSPITFYANQDLSSLYGLSPKIEFDVPPLSLRFGLVEDATLIVESGCDGIVLDRYSRVIEETSYYSSVWRRQEKSGRIDTNAPTYEIDTLFISFDAAWFNYYHWLCFAIGSAAIATSLIDPHIPIGFPDFADRKTIHPVGFSADVHDRSVRMVVPPRRVRMLPRGIYHIKHAHIMYVSNGQNTDLTMHPLFCNVFKKIGQKCKTDGPPTRLFISRAGQGSNGRISVEEEAQVLKVASQYGFVTTSLENLNFDDQVDLFARAEAIIGPHGSGLTNILFSPPETRLVELSRVVDANGKLRPWFYIICQGASHRYSLVNADAGEISTERIALCLNALGLEESRFLM